ncbi:hypothetical protein CF326_g8311 [Tilletia indica]|nr:hypothetical protein CF326_g8311 [Tilletia indica]
MLADPSTLDRFLSHPIISHTLVSFRTVLLEIASMIDPFLAVAINQKQASAIDSPLESSACPGFGPFYSSDDERISIFQPLFGAVLASITLPHPGDTRYSKAGHPQPNNPEAVAHATRVAGPILEELFQYIVDNAYEMAVERSGKTYVLVMIKKLLLDKHGTKMGRVATVAATNNAALCCDGETYHSNQSACHGPRPRLKNTSGALYAIVTTVLCRPAAPMGRARPKSAIRRR